VINFRRLQNEVVEWRVKCVQSKCFCTHSNTNAIDLDTLWDELTHKKVSYQINAYKCELFDLYIY